MSVIGALKADSKSLESKMKQFLSSSLSPSLCPSVSHFPPYLSLFLSAFLAFYKEGLSEHCPSHSGPPAPSDLQMVVVQGIQKVTGSGTRGYTPRRFSDQ